MRALPVSRRQVCRSKASCIRRVPAARLPVWPGLGALDRGMGQPYKRFRASKYRALDFLEGSTVAIPVNSCPAPYGIRLGSGHGFGFRVGAKLVKARRPRQKGQPPSSGCAQLVSLESKLTLCLKWMICNSNAQTVRKRYLGTAFRLCCHG